jgi:hypothetical protein
MRRTPGLRLAFWLSFYRGRNAFYGSEDERCFSKSIAADVIPLTQRAKAHLS